MSTENTYLQSVFGTTDNTGRFRSTEELANAGSRLNTLNLAVGAYIEPMPDVASGRSQAHVRRLLGSRWARESRIS